VALENPPGSAFLLAAVGSHATARFAERGLVERRRNRTDRRLHALHITDEGRAMLVRIGKVGREHDDALCRSLDAAERETLRDLLVRIAADQGLRPGIHPGYRSV
jgi:DNA-binding MarR family transcriptional regulator